MPVALQKFLGDTYGNYLQISIKQFEDAIGPYFEALHIDGVAGAGAVRQGVRDDLFGLNKPAPTRMIDACTSKGKYDEFVKKQHDAIIAFYDSLSGADKVDPTIDINRVTPDQMMQQFAVDDHQFKHYRNGAGKYGLFSDLDHTAVHRLIVHGTRQIIAEQKRLEYPAVKDGFIVVTGTRLDRWPAGNGKGRTNIVKLQIAASKKTFSGHGYPVGQDQYRLEVTVGRKFLSLEIADDAWTAVALTAENVGIRTRQQH